MNYCPFRRFEIFSKVGRGRLAGKNYTWVNFYEELADKLLEYKDNRAELISKIKRVYSSIGLKLPTLDSDDKLTDIDPFTVFGLFNKGISEKNRLALSEALRANSA